jgi:hypothetical protein
MDVYFQTRAGLYPTLEMDVSIWIYPTLEMDVYVWIGYIHPSQGTAK